MDVTTTTASPSERWRQDATRPTTDLRTRLRLAAMAGHMSSDGLAARRAALIDILSTGGVLTGDELRDRVAAQMGAGCWGRRPAEALLRDVKALRRGGVRIAYSRQRGLEGYYVDYPPLEGSHESRFNRVDRVWLERVRAMSGPEKTQTAFAAADFALRQKRLRLREEHDDWPDEQLEAEARRLVFGVRLHE